MNKFGLVVFILVGLFANFNSINAQTIDTLQNEQVKRAALPPPPKEEVIFKVVEEIPRFPGCEGQGLSKEELKQCSNRRFLEYVNRNIDYPTLAKDSCIEGTCIVEFVIAKDGTVKNVALVKDIGFGCGQAAVDVIEEMNERKIYWGPRKARGRPLEIKYILPVKFKLSKEEKMHCDKD